MEGKLLKPAVTMTRSPILVREYFDDVMPKPINWEFNSYVIHDPSLRSQMPSGTNLVSKQIRAKYSLRGTPESTVCICTSTRLISLLSIFRTLDQTAA